MHVRAFLYPVYPIYCVFRSELQNSATALLNKSTILLRHSICLLPKGGTLKQMDQYEYKKGKKHFRQREKTFEIASIGSLPASPSRLRTQNVQKLKNKTRHLGKTGSPLYRQKSSVPFKTNPSLGKCEGKFIENLSLFLYK